MKKYSSEAQKDAQAFSGKDFSIRNSLFGKYGKVYAFTNENVANCMKLVDFSKKKSALTVLSSGDHAFNLITEGIINVDTFDINKLTEYYALGLKRAMIMKYSYKEFLDIVDVINYQRGPMYSPFDVERFNTSEDIIKQVVFDLLYDMDKEHRDFWLCVLDGYRDYKILSFRLFQDDCEEITFNNNYLKNEEAYNRLKSRLGKANISFINARILEVPNRFRSREYDVVMFSNILDYMNDTLGEYWGYKKISRFEKKVEKMCSDDSTIFFHYVLGWRSFGVITDSRPVFRASSVYLQDFEDMKVELLNEASSFEGVLVKRIKR